MSVLTTVEKGGVVEIGTHEDKLRFDLAAETRGDTWLVRAHRPLRAGALGLTGARRRPEEREPGGEYAVVGSYTAFSGRTRDRT